ncbi:MAG: hypothetical protein DRP74_00310 [Candidatus Omnitrophota bacterium]|nr:MAG: hypothetical protein DRP74_00310 [Candidatus Omnitrophota bacterium]
MASKEYQFKKIIPIFLLLIFMFTGVCGCATALVVGAAVGVVGGYAISKDTIEGETDVDYDNLWRAALRISRIRGTIREEDKARGLIDAEIEASRVYIRLSRLTAATTRLRVSARKYHFPNLNLAQDMFVKIMEEVK